MLVSNQRPLPCEVCRAGPNAPRCIKTFSILTPISPSAWSMFSCRLLLFSIPVAAWLQHTIPFRVDDHGRVGHKRGAGSVVETPGRVDARHRRRGRAALGVARAPRPRGVRAVLLGLLPGGAPLAQPCRAPRGGHRNLRLPGARRARPGGALVGLGRGTLGRRSRHGRRHLLPPVRGARGGRVDPGGREAVRSPPPVPGHRVGAVRARARKTGGRRLACKAAGL